jgi:hypothetical protein
MAGRCGSTRAASSSTESSPYRSISASSPCFTGAAKEAPRRADLGGVLGRQRGVDRVEPGRVDRNAGEDGADDSRVGEVDDDVLDRGDVQALEHQVEDLEVGAEALVAVDLGAELEQARASRPLPEGRACSTGPQ